MIIVGFHIYAKNKFMKLIKGYEFGLEHKTVAQP